MTVAQASLAKPPRFVPSKESLVNIAASLCKNARKPVNKAFLRVLMDYEVKHKVPSYARGIILAAACKESGFRAKPRRGDKGKAVGLLQMWPWWEKLGVKRERPGPVVDAWLSHVNKSKKKARRKCKAPWRAWLVAQAWVSSGPQGWTCRYSRHYRLLRRWRWLLKSGRFPPTVGSKSRNGKPRGSRARQRPRKRK